MSRKQKTALTVILPIITLGLTACQSSTSTVVVSHTNAPLPTVDYTKFQAIDDKEYYDNKIIGSIFVIETFKATYPLENEITVFGNIPFTVHPEQDISAIEFRDSNYPTVITGLGEGWGKILLPGYGDYGIGAITGEFDVSFSLIGRLYPEPICRFDVIISRIYIGRGNLVFKTDTGAYLEVPNTLDLLVDPQSQLDIFPITYQPIPQDYVVKIKKNTGNISFDAYYYLRYFISKPPPYQDISDNDQYYQIGCGDLDLDVAPGYFPEDLPIPDVWDDMLTPESQRETPGP
jgi:hypothetical protein